MSAIEAQTLAGLTWADLEARYHALRGRQHARFYAGTTAEADPPPLRTSDTCGWCARVGHGICCGWCLIERIVWTRDLTWEELGLS